MADAEAHMTEAVSPAPGDICICLRCTGLMLVTASDEREKLTPAQFGRLEAHIQSEILLTAAAICEFHKQGDSHEE